MLWWQRRQQDWRRCFVTKNVRLIDGTYWSEGYLMCRRVGSEWQYRHLNQTEQYELEARS